MTTAEPLDDATRDNHRANLTAIADARAKLGELLDVDEPAAIVAARRAGLPQVEVMKYLGRSREFVRKVERANGIEADYTPDDQ